VLIWSETELQGDAKPLVALLDARHAELAAGPLLSDGFEVADSGNLNQV
jgi:hypothetical protein